MARAYSAVYGNLERYLADQGITGAQFGVLRCVADAGDAGLMLSDLSRRLMVTCANITGVVDRLEQAGYLRRERSHADRRVVLARLTPEGEALFARVWPEFQALVAELLREVPPEVQAQLAAACRGLHESLQARVESTPWSEEAIPTASGGGEARDSA
jgi:MarR family 2-MHQ and catechol resistance regulon transcriptional repressor